MNYIFALLLGFTECFFITIETKFLQRSKVIQSMTFSFTNVMLWFVVFGLASENLHNWGMKISYGLGFSLGIGAGIRMDSYLEKIAKIKGFRFKKRKKDRRLK